MRPPPDRRRGGEDQLIAWLKRRIRRQSGETAIGDDAAILPPDSFAVTVDHQIADVHFPRDTAPAVVARRLLAVNLSDLAAMGAGPAHAFLALAAPEGFDHRKFLAALLAACARFGVQLAGGDLARSPERLSASLTLLGTKAGARWVGRDGARPGHALWVGGTLGESAAGRLVIEKGGAQSQPKEAFSSPALARIARHAVKRHLEPRPQLALGRWLADQDAGGGMDISDGLARDLHRLCRASGTGAEVDAAALPFAAGFAPLCGALGADPLTLALSGGEDYVLLFTLPPMVVPPAELGARRIGRITRRGVSLLRAGIRETLPDAGWDHLTALI